jgi:alkanesulfonate monooxygenase SsuD/methylene tetrahydromethanopterin reductase-like flavin-dependent oxidoreductase (luciferase family)
MAGVNVFAADIDTDAQRLFTSVQQQITNRLRGTPGRLPRRSTISNVTGTPRRKAEVSARLACAFVGSPAVVSSGLVEFMERTAVDEIMVVSAIYEHAARLRSYELVAEHMIEAPSRRDVTSSRR